MALALVCIQYELGCGTLTLVDVLSLGKFAQPVVPLGFQHVGDQAVVGMHPSEAILREFSFVACSLDVLLP